MLLKTSAALQAIPEPNETEVGSSSRLAACVNKLSFPRRPSLLGGRQLAATRFYYGLGWTVTGGEIGANMWQNTLSSPEPFARGEHLFSITGTTADVSDRAETKDQALDAGVLLPSVV